MFLVSNETEASCVWEMRRREEVTKKLTEADRHLPRRKRKCPASQGVLLSMHLA